VNIYYLADVRSVLDRSPALPADVTIRSIAETDITLLAETYLRAFGPAAVGSLNDAVTEMKAASDGAWGALWPEASPAAWKGGELAGAVQTVRRPSWEGAPDCPWLIDVFTDPRHRRAGIARVLIGAACRVMSEAGEPCVGLTVDDGNLAAVTLYKSLGFTQSA
jgi:N-alpha-acetyltransferase 10/11